MATAAKELEFFYEDMAVGYFEEPEFPSRPGRYRYMPYRGPGHHKMQTARRSGERPKCYYCGTGIRVTFLVVDCPEYGVLELTDFATQPPASPSPPAP